MTSCKVCRKPKKYPKKSYASRALHEADPYCSRKCCEQDHGVTHLPGSTARNYSAWYAA